MSAPIESKIWKSALMKSVRPVFEVIALLNFGESL